MAKQKMPKLRECPFCGCDGECLEIDESDVGTCVRCRACGAFGPCHEVCDQSPQANLNATQSWNKRVTDQPGTMESIDLEEKIADAKAALAALEKAVVK